MVNGSTASQSEYALKVAPYHRMYTHMTVALAYMFPVTQCSGCWQFGHIIKYCPTRKKLCPKCGDNHENCDTTDIKCLNCKGAHLVLDKSCPSYLKERQIRIIMCEEQVPYRNALRIYNEKREVAIHGAENLQNSSLGTNAVRGTETYSSIVAGSFVRTEPSLEQDPTVRSKEVVLEPT